MSEKMFDIIVVGELNVDLILNRIDSFPEMGKEKLAEKMDLVLGSSSAIFASNLSSLGAAVTFIGKIGKDIFGNLVIDSLKQKNVDTSLILRDEKLKTGATIVLNYGEDRAMVTYQGAMQELRIDDFTVEKLQTAKHMHLSSPFLQPEIKKDIYRIFSMAKNAGLTTSLDPQWDPNEKWDLDLEKLLPLVDLFIPNKEEILRLTRKNNIKDALESVKEFANIIVIKMGSEGSLLWEHGSVNEEPAFLNDNVVDAIGAGDSFDAGFIYKFIKGANLKECQRFGNLMGALNTTAPGGTAAFSNYRQIIETAKEKFGFVE